MTYTCRKYQVFCNAHLNKSEGLEGKQILNHRAGVRRKERVKEGKYGGCILYFCVKTEQ
jgi:hypothetical protein